MEPPSDQANRSAENTDSEVPTHEFDELRDLYLFDELYQFCKESTGLSIFIAYITMIMSSVTYLYVLYQGFDIQIFTYLTLEDILATPIKNPDIMLTFIVILLVIYLSDIANRYRARQEIKYFNKQKPLWIRILLTVSHMPKKRKANLKITVGTMYFCIVAYNIGFALREEKSIKEGSGEQVEISLADETEPFQVTLLGSTMNYLFTYDHRSQASTIYYVESVKSLKVIASSESEQNLRTNDDSEAKS